MIRAIDRSDEHLSFAILMVGALLTFRVELPGAIPVNLSLFEPLLGCLLLREFWCRGIRQHGRIIAVACAVLAALFVHGLITEPLPEHRVFWLKGYIRNMLVVLDVAGLLILLSGMDFKEKQRAWLARLTHFLLLAYLIVGVMSISFYSNEITPRTVFTLNLLFLLFLHVHFSKRISSWLTGVLAVLIVAASLYSLSKIGAVISCALLFAIVWRALDERDIKGRIFLLALVVAGGIALVMIWPHVEVNGRELDSPFRSLSVRLSLWTAAIQGISDSFPLGIGAGLFKPYLQEIDPHLYQENHQYIHSLPLSYLSELGLLGAIILCLFSVVFIRACRGFGKTGLHWSYLSICLPAMILHDVQSIRIFMLVLVFGFVLERAKRADQTPVLQG